VVFIIAFSTLLGLAYLLLIILLNRTLGSMSSDAPIASESPSVSILVPFRNEETELPKLLKAVEALDYPRDCFELILVDDHSDDRSLSMVTSFKRTSSVSTKVLQLGTETGKKAALQLAMAQASYDLVVQTDADCRFSNMWLRRMVGSLEKETQVVAGVVSMESQGGFWSRFAAMEYMSLQAITAAFIGLKKPIMASGANLLYSKELWSQAKLKTERHSGDDTFFIQQAGRGGVVLFALDKEAQVTTKAPATLKELLNQRARWGGKSFSYPSLSARLLAVLITLLNLQILILLLLSIKNPGYALALIAMIVVKGLADFFFLRHFARLSDQRHLMKHFVPSSIVYPFYILITVLYILFGKAEWKGRSFSPATD
jgi:biofilm PGA synthesis N-glycosyltransferase PgaC